MRIIKAGYEFPNGKPVTSDVYQAIERAGRTCYKSEDLITDESAEKFVRGLIKRGHEAMLEHVSMTVKFIVDRGVSHELVRHRIASFAQESTRYCDYSKDKHGHEITVIAPCFFWKNPPLDIAGVVAHVGWSVPEHPELWLRWKKSCEEAEEAYFCLLETGATPQEARSVLPNSLKTEVVVTMNMREWRHFFKLRAAGVTGKPHPQMLEVTVPLLKEMRECLPALFDDIEPMEVD